MRVLILFLVLFGFLGQVSAQETEKTPQRMFFDFPQDCLAAYKTDTAQYFFADPGKYTAGEPDTILFRYIVTEYDLMGVVLNPEGRFSFVVIGKGAEFTVDKGYPFGFYFQGQRVFDITRIDSALEEALSR